MKRLTAETITDTEIRELKARMLDRFQRGVDTKEDREVIADCDSAIHDHPTFGGGNLARARCAEVLNAPYLLYVVGQRRNGSYETFELMVPEGEGIDAAGEACTRRNLTFLHCSRPKPRRAS